MGRASRRQQRAEEQLGALSMSHSPVPPRDEADRTPDLGHAEGVDSGSDDSIPGTSNAFGTLSYLTHEMESKDDDGESEAEATSEKVTSKKSKSKKSKSKKKSKNKSSVLSPSSQDGPLPSPGNPPERDNTQFQKKAAPVDEIDAALQSLNLIGKIDTKKSLNQSSTNSQDSITASLFSIIPKMLDADQELTRMFGSRVVSSAMRTTAPSTAAYYGARISNNPHHHLNLKSKSTMLSKPQPNWSQFHRTSSGLNMISIDELQKRTSGLEWSRDDWFCFEHSVTFRVVQSRFLRAIMSLDPNQLFSLLQTLPYHPDTLLQLSEVMSEQGDPGQALDFLNRALYSFEKSLHPTLNLAKGEGRLDFRHIENRGFFRALEKKMQVLMKRGCWRTAFETCKLLLGLNPYRDPYGALLWVDLLSVKAKQYQYLVDFVDHIPQVQSQDPDGGIYTESYPGLYYSKALCLRALEGGQTLTSPSNLALETAILRFPQVLIPLCQKISVDLPSTFHKSKRAFPQDQFNETSENVLHLKSHMYVTRSGDLWKNPESRTWLQETIQRCYSKLEDPRDPDVILGQEFAASSHQPSTLEGIYRSVFVSDSQALKKFLPPTPPQNVAYSFDPWPPADGTHYDESYFQNSALPSETAAPHRNRPRDQDFPAAPLGDNNMRAIFDRLLDDLEHQNVDQGLINLMIEQIQFTLQEDEAALTPQDRIALLERLDRLLEHVQDTGGAQAQRAGVEQTNDRPEEPASPINQDLNRSGDHENDRVNEPRHTHRMPGTFWDAESDSD